MKSTASLTPAITTRSSEFEARYDEYFTTKPAIVRGLHYVLSAFAILFVLLAVITFGIAIYYTLVWAFSGTYTLLDDAWVAFGMACSLMVFPGGLDSMLMLWFPAVIFPARWYRSSKPINFKTGWKYIFAGFGIMCAGAPGFVYYYGLLAETLSKVF